MEKIRGTRTIGWSSIADPRPEVDKKKAQFLTALF